MNKRIGLFFGSFNPIHCGHLIIANYIVEYSDIDELWFIVSPHNPLKNKSQLANEYHRLEMVNLAITDYEKFKVSDIEFHLPKPSYTIDTLTALSDQYPHYQFSIIMGSDNLATLSKWKNYNRILKNYSIIVYPRKNFNPDKNDYSEKVTIVDAPLIEISSTFIRKAIHEKKNVRFFVPEKVWQYIIDCNLYR